MLLHDYSLSKLASFGPKRSAAYFAVGCNKMQHDLAFSATAAALLNTEPRASASGNKMLLHDYGLSELASFVPKVRPPILRWPRNKMQHDCGLSEIGFVRHKGPAFTLLAVWAAVRICRIVIPMQGKSPKVADLVRWAVRG